MTNKFPGIPNIFQPIVDVRDCANAHLKALTCSPNLRIPLSSKMISLTEIGETLKELFGTHGYKVSTKELPYWIFYIAAMLDKSAKAYKPCWGTYWELENQLSIQ